MQKRIKDTPVGNSHLGTATNETATVGGDTATLARTLDHRHRLAELRSGNAAPVHYGYDSESRHSAVSNTAFRATYAYTSDGWDAGYSVALTNGVVLARNLTRDPYRRSLVKAITNSVSGVPYNPLVYTYDLLNRVTSRNTDTFDYNARSEVTAADIGAHTNRYAFDNIGNALWASLNSVTNIYTANELNQYFLISNHVNHVNPVQISPVYDLDGNMTWDGRFNYTYDAENRLAAAYSNGLCVVFNAYDHLSRRVLKISRGGTETRGFVYDGWLPVLEIVATAAGVTTNHYVWGRDLSGSMQGAGGVGGLLAVQMGSAWYFPFYDNNGNITAYVNEQGAIVAEYTYDAFGRTIEATGLLADAFRHRFSTKYYDAETGFYYYGYRFYSPTLHRWLNRDPIGEQGGLNLYGFVYNAPTRHIDRLGLLVRSDIEKGRVLYSCNCGWIDIVHSKGAVPNAAAILSGVVGNLGGTPSEITFALTQTLGGLQFGYAINIPETPKKFSEKDAIEIALGIWMHANVTFEQWQGGTGAELFKKSSFSVEDMPSDYLAMMMAVRDRYGPGKGISWSEIKSQCHFLDIEDSLWVYNCGIGPKKNHFQTPELWESRPTLEWCWPCQRVMSLTGGQVFPKIPDIFSAYNPAAQVDMFKQTMKKDINPIPGL